MAPELPVYWDDAFLEHRPPGGGWLIPKTELHDVEVKAPERPERARNVKSGLEGGMSEWTTWEQVSPASQERIEAVHDSTYVEEMRAFFEEGGGRISHDGVDGITGGNEGTAEALPLAAGAAVQTAERAVESDIDTVPFAPVRPPGHHAMSDEADGFCVFNNVAIAAQFAIDEGVADTVAILDWDVHHGNGTQEIFYGRDDVLTLSLHYNHGRLSEWHSQTGHTEEQGTGDGEGYNVNVPLPHGTGNVGYAYAFDELVEPIVAEYSPDLLLVSNGLDPGRYDPIGRNVVTKPGFKEMGRRTRELAETHSDGSLGVVLEGGYNVSHLPFATVGVFEGLLDVETDISDPYDFEEHHNENIDEVQNWVRETQMELAENWDVSVV